MEGNKEAASRDKNKIYSNNIMGEMMTTLVNGATANDLAAFKEYIDENPEKIADYATDIKYSYSTQLNVYTSTGVRVNPSEVFEKLGFSALPSKANFLFAKHEKVSGKEIYLSLKEKGVLVRYFDKDRLKAYNRITIGNRKEMEILIQKLTEVLKELL